ncbi:methionyl-tRNA formyltransferase [Heliomicrobium modesticaldum Ice1]|uniref:Methionyl-tRNA formyltransferase n=1 Tax=Heliobacterium modesticaldum (strain ATCC 51547 / Ice1) TaxID=498761 RepID=FMT_HELMI|nr:methionyl-tRNA formyltransferase [Heliomicrobium modesticaldum]B0TGS9.1 RecName: Full=Methionyl-tRNA formyltransferase [Heliomicrobium modesticaldum Ice1]ABZ84690.1 methionyl-tRNA formyltransferase [Heliomicrobium modesticaldum Ice1]
MRLVFMGTPDFAVPTLEAIVAAGHEVALVVTRPDRPRGRGQKPQPSPVKEAALRLGLPVDHPACLDNEFVQKLKDLGVEAGVVVAFGRILPPRLLDAFPQRWINVHASLLPKYRGAAPIHRAVIDGEKETGITTMLMSEGLDEGDMLLKRSLAIGPDDTTGQVHDALAELGARLLVETLAAMEAGRLQPQPQDGSQASYAPMLARADEQVDWSAPAEAVHNRVRGMNPWPGAFTMDEGKILKILRGRLRHEGLPLPDPTGSAAHPGEILQIVGDEVAVATGAGVYWLSEVRPAGGKTMTAGAYARGRRIGPGFRFG